MEEKNKKVLKLIQPHNLSDYTQKGWNLEEFVDVSFTHSADGNPIRSFQETRILMSRSGESVLAQTLELLERARHENGMLVQEIGNLKRSFRSLTSEMETKDEALSSYLRAEIGEARVRELLGEGNV